MTTACRDGNRCLRGGMAMISLLAVVLLASLVSGASAYAYPRTLVAEPLAEGMPPSQGFRGAARILGALAEGERHAFTWSIDDREVGYLWQISLRATTAERLRVSLHPDQASAGQGEPQGVTTFGEAPATSTFGTADEASGDASHASDPAAAEGRATEKPLLTLEATPDTAGDRVTSLLVSHGDYRIEVETQGGQGEYQLTVEPAGEVSLHGTADAPSNADALVVGPGRDWFYQLNASRLQLPLEIDENDARLWRLSLLTELGHAVRAQPVDASDEPLVASTGPLPMKQQWDQLALEEGAALALARDEEGEAIGRVRVRLEPGEAFPEPAPEPVAATREDALALPAQATQVLELLPGQRSYLAFELNDEEAQGQGWALDLLGPEDPPIEACLADALGQEAICRTGPREALFDRLRLDPGRHYLALTPSEQTEEAGVAVEVIRRSVPRPTSQEVAEPNDSREVATALSPEQELQGTFNGPRKGVFRLEVPRSDQVWRIVASGDGLEDLRLYQSGHSGRSHFARSQAYGPVGEKEGLGFSRLDLMAGTYYLELSGSDSDYRILAERLDADEEGWEREPNDTRGQANALTFGGVMRGDLHDASDEDWYRFTLPGDNRIRLKITPPDAGSVQPILYRDEERIAAVHPRRALDTSPLILTGRLPAGDYYLWLGDREPAGPYRVRLDLQAPWEPLAGHAMATRQELAVEPPPDGRIELPHSGLGSDYQWFRLPVGDSPREVRIKRLGDNRLSRAHVELIDEQGDALPTREVETARDNAEAVAVQIPARAKVYLRVSSARLGHIDLILEDPLIAERQAESQRHHDAIEARFEADGPLTAWHDAPQRLESRLVLSNGAEAPVTLPLEAHASHAGWRIDALPDTLTLDPGEEVVLTPAWTLPAGLDDEAPVSLFIGVAGQTLEATLAVGSTDTEAGVSLGDVALRDRAQGLVDLAWWGLGAYFEDPDSGEPIIDDATSGWGTHRVASEPRLVHLIDGMSSMGSHLRYRGEPGEALPPLRLAGDGGDVEMLVINQRSGQPPEQRWRELEVSLGDTPDDLEVVTTLELDAADGEQFFALGSSRQARYLGLRPLGFWGETGRLEDTGIGQLRVLGEPADELARQRLDLLADRRGGHWITTRPEVPALNEMTLPERNAFQAHGAHGDRLGRGLARGGEWQPGGVSLVFGFLQQRAARLGELGWQEAPEHRGQPIETVRVYSSTESPVGPWQHQADWHLERDAQGLAELTLDTPVWARYLRLEVLMPEPDPEQAERRWRLPAEIRAHEAEPLGGGESILAYWPEQGREGQAGPYELTLGEEALPEAVDDDASHPDAPRRLEERITGRLAQPNDTRSYRVRIEEGHNTLVVRLRETLRGRIQASLVATDGETQSFDWQREPEGWRRGEAVGLPPGEYRLDITEPARAIAFLWDASGSLEALQAPILQAINRFAEGLDPDQEVANLMPLGGPMLLDEWSGEPRILRHTLAAYDGRFESSDAEPALQSATRALEALDRERVIFLITDAEQMGRAISVWDDLERVQPRIFTLEISHGQQRLASETRWYQNQMRSWANVGGGRYAYTLDRRDLVRAFEVGMQEVRQPTTFALEVTSRYQEPPEPGSLRVVSADPEQPAVAGGVVHLIFDASGSMLRQMEGGRRIEVARRIVQQVLDERIPEQVPVALRAYGHTEPHSCETELLVEPRAGNHDEVREVVSGIQAINLARTPLAASIDAVLEDLSGYEDQRRLVVMLTDGEETCDGDVAASVEALIEEGVDVRLNIVGFHIDEVGLQAEFERFAAQGGGEYFDSHDGDELIAGLSQALAATWRVLDSDGSEVARGRVDDVPIALDVGEYELLVETQSGEWRQAFEIGPREDKNLEVSGED
ncbi:VWA domain-containing protein [Halomonas chromatireducens]|nr:VWA domain-containing protein [Halomonas chromatireducens]